VVEPGARRAIRGREPVGDPALPARPDPPAAGVLARTGAPPESIRVELTENVIMKQAEATVRTLESLRSVGVSLMIDDFGTGYSSLSYLHRFAAQALKIDDAFIAPMGPTARTARSCGPSWPWPMSWTWRSWRRGWRRPEQLRMVRILGCSAAQGYFLGRPGGWRRRRQPPWIGSGISADARSRRSGSGTSRRVRA
jgi:predicted signal transduction protein with EAL and GGDEF domain